MKKEQLRADIMLLLVTIGWGVSYYMMSICLKELGPFTLGTYRFIGAFTVALIFTYSKLKSVNRITIKYSIILAMALYVTYIGATFGVMFTKLSNVGFLCALSVVIVPILDFFLKKRVPSKKLGIVVLMSLIGIGLLTLSESMVLAWGDILCIICALAYAVNMVMTETAVSREKVNAYQLGVFQLFFTGTFFFFTALGTEQISLPKSVEVWTSMIFLMVFCTGFAFIAQCIAQQHTTATHVGVIFGLEPIFAAFAAYFLAGDILSVRGYLGAAIMLLGFFIMEMDFKKIIGRRRR